MPGFAPGAEGTSPSRRAPFETPGVSAAVASIGSGRFAWNFSASFDDSDTSGWSAADFAPLTIGGHSPSEIDEIIGGDGSLTLVYDFDPPPPGLFFDIGSQPTVLRFAGGQGLTLPQGGTVT